MQALCRGCRISSTGSKNRINVEKRPLQRNSPHVRSFCHSILCASFHNFKHLSRAKQPRNAPERSSSPDSPADILTTRRDLQSLKDPSSSLVTASGRFTQRRAVQPLKVDLAIEVTLRGTLKAVRDSQPLKAASPIELTCSVSVTDCNDTQPAKALAPMEFTNDETVRCFKWIQP